MLYMKKVIFVGGTSYSGSTFFQLTLANDPHGFACGEVRPLFYPARERHLYRACGCGAADCRVWEQIKKGGEQHLYETIFDLFPEVEFILESSKNVHWIKEQSTRLRRRGFDVRHIMIWKTPLEYAHSLKKRKRLDELGNWPRYHRLYYSLIDDWRALRYYDYTQDQARVLQRVCDYLGIPNFPGKERFWEKQHHSLGGNLSSRIHLFSEGSTGYQNVKARAQHELSAATDTQYRKVYYEKPGDDSLQPLVRQMKQEAPEVDRIEEMLLAFDVFHAGVSQTQWPDLRLSPSSLTLKRLRLATLDQISKYKLALSGR
jgi:hypothetical protein